MKNLFHQHLQKKHFSLKKKKEKMKRENSRRDEIAVNNVKRKHLMAFYTYLSASTNFTGLSHSFPTKKLN